MTEPAPPEPEEALERVIAAARAHLAAVRAAAGAIDDQAVWRSYVLLNNASFAYDQLLLDEFGEVTPWETESIDLRMLAETRAGQLLTGAPQADPHPAVLSVRQRRDYRVPSVTALMAAAETAVRRMTPDGEELEAPETIADAVLELVRYGDGSLAGLDVAELEPLAGVVAVAEVAEGLDLDQDETTLFELSDDDRMVGRMDEEPLVGPDRDEPEAEDAEADAAEREDGDGGDAETDRDGRTIQN